MINLHGLILADRSSSQLSGLVKPRTSASLPFAGRYRLIDFALSAMQNALVRDVGVIMQHDYQSLLDHLGSGKEWDMSRKRGGLRLLPPFGLKEERRGQYSSIIDALTSVQGYIRDIQQDYICLCRGSLAANIDLAEVMRRHVSSGADVTVVCSDRNPESSHYRFVTDEHGFATELLKHHGGKGEGYASLEVYIMSKKTLLGIIERCERFIDSKFHRTGLGGILASGGRIAVYMHHGYAAHINSVSSYYSASMDMLQAQNRHELFPDERPVRTKGRADVSTHYAEGASVKNCLVADGCYIEGSIENCIIFRGVQIHKDAVLKNCIIMQDSIIDNGANLSYVIADKDVEIGVLEYLSGSPRFPLVLPKGTVI